MTFVRGVAVDPATQETFFDKVDNANDIAYRDVREAALREKAAYENYYYSKGWFSCDARCTANYEMYQKAQKKSSRLPINAPRGIIGCKGNRRNIFKV